MDTDDTVAALERWVTSGGIWVVHSRTPTRLTLGLLTCDGGTEADRIVTSSPAVLEHVGGRQRSDD